MYIAEIEARVAGIPCIIGVDGFAAVKGSSSGQSDLDYRGYTEAQWEVCDRRGRPAPWLERKLTERDSDAIEEKIADYFSEK